MCFFFLHKCNISNHYRAIIPPTPNFSVLLSPRAWFFFISQHGEFETQPTQTTFTVWQMKLINNLKHALTVAHTIMLLNMFLLAGEMHLNCSQNISLQQCTSKTNIIVLFFPYINVAVSFYIPQCDWYSLYLQYKPGFVVFERLTAGFFHPDLVLVRL